LAGPHNRTEFSLRVPPVFEEGGAASRTRRFLLSVGAIQLFRFGKRLQIRPRPADQGEEFFHARSLSGFEFPPLHVDSVSGLAGEVMTRRRAARQSDGRRISVRRARVSGKRPRGPSASQLRPRGDFLGYKTGLSRYPTSSFQKHPYRGAHLHRVRARFAHPPIWQASCAPLRGGNTRCAAVSSTSLNLRRRYSLTATIENDDARADEFCALTENQAGLNGFNDGEEGKPVIDRFGNPTVPPGNVA
jgi:hypothetical protein